MFTHPDFSFLFSAGVGRTGVFIAIDKILDDLDDEYETNIDVFGFVEEMRSRRINMVQTAVGLYGRSGQTALIEYI